MCSPVFWFEIKRHNSNGCGRLIKGEVGSGESVFISQLVLEGTPDDPQFEYIQAGAPRSDHRLQSLAIKQVEQL